MITDACIYKFQKKLDLFKNGTFSQTFTMTSPQTMKLDALESWAFSEDILHIKVSDLDQPQLILINLPDLIHFKNKKQSVHDVKLAHKLMKSYMKDQWSIILAVVSAINEFANQIMLKKTHEINSYGKYTIDIIMKPNTLHIRIILKKKFLALAQNKNVKFEHEWYVVKNLNLRAGKGEIKNRDSEESLFFQKSNFKSLPSCNIGISSLCHHFS